MAFFLVVTLLIVAPWRSRSMEAACSSSIAFSDNWSRRSRFTSSWNAFATVKSGSGGSSAAAALPPPSTDSTPRRMSRIGFNSNRSANLRKSTLSFWSFFFGAVCEVGLFDFPPPAAAESAFLIPYASTLSITMPGSILVRHNSGNKLSESFSMSRTLLLPISLLVDAAAGGSRILRASCSATDNDPSAGKRKSAALNAGDCDAPFFPVCGTPNFSRILSGSHGRRNSCRIDAATLGRCTHWRSGSVGGKKPLNS
mmetsp:Transcript_19537/g.49024  ORF Transcript_19537/g.49024 Transcript_19537/m.49024 type:complete len:255 (-) Transcript_19537:859-1623(-)